MRKLSSLTNKEQSEALDFVKDALKKRFGDKAGWLTTASEELEINYSQLVNTIAGRTKPSKRLLASVGYQLPEYITPLGRNWTQGRIIEVELTPEAHNMLRKLEIFHPEYEFKRQEAKVWNNLMSQAVKHFCANPAAFLEVREKTAAEPEPWIAAGKISGIKTAAALGSDYEPDVAPEDEMELDVFG